MKAISLHQPWATWIALGWKTIETRRHNRFQSLEGQRIAIHAALSFDHSAYEAAMPFLSELQRHKWFEFRRNQIPHGALVATALVHRFSYGLFEDHDASALIECKTHRTGLFLRDIAPLYKPIPCTGRQGIFEVTL